MFATAEMKRPEMQPITWGFLRKTPNFQQSTAESYVNKKKIQKAIKINSNILPK